MEEKLSGTRPNVLISPQHHLAPRREERGRGPREAEILERLGSPRGRGAQEAGIPERPTQPLGSREGNPASLCPRSAQLQGFLEPTGRRGTKAVGDSIRCQAGAQALGPTSPGIFYHSSHQLLFPTRHQSGTQRRSQEEAWDSQRRSLVSTISSPCETRINAILYQRR